MRPSAWVTLLVFVICVAGVRAHSTRASSKAAPKPAAPAPAAGPSWVVEGKLESNEEDALNSALVEAQAVLETHLRNTDPRLVWTPTPEYIREHLLKDLDLPEQDDDAKSLRRAYRHGHYVLVEEKTFKDPVGKMRRVRLKVGLNADDYAKIKQRDGEERKKQREAVSHQRQTALARGLAAAVALLVAVVGYFRLEEATKGYYTAWLRLAAAGLIAAVIAGLLLAA